MIYGPPHPAEYTIERNCCECCKEFTADRRDEDDVLCEECIEKAKKGNNENQTLKL
jgi:PHP family Zn ribbon phosphoesterase